MKHVAKISSSIIFVSDLDRSVEFYRDVFACEVALRDQDAALLLTPGGFQLYLTARSHRAQHASGGIGVQYLMWATDSEEGLKHFEQAFKDLGRHTDTHSAGGVRFVEGRDPDGIRVVVAYPSPEQRPRSVLDARFYT